MEGHGLCKKKTQIVVLCAGIVQFVCLGMMYSWSEFAPMIRAELGLNHAQATFPYSICMAMFTIGILTDSVLGRRFSTKTSSLMGILLSASGYLLTSLISLERWELLWLFYGTLVGFGIGLVYNGWLSHIMRWFPGHFGFASGCLLLGMGLCGVILTPAVSTVADWMGWRIALRGFAVLLIVVGFLHDVLLKLHRRRKKGANPLEKPYSP